MHFSAQLALAVFLQRLNRFTVLVELDGKPVQAHLPNSGRLGELLVAGTTAFLVKKDQPWRKTKYDMALVSIPLSPPLKKGEEGLVSVDARLPSNLVEEALNERRLAPFQAYRRFQREVVYGDSRLDFRLEGRGRTCLLEVKSVTKVRSGVAMFPDAVTARGSRHVRTLLEAKRRGLAAAVAFVVQRVDAVRFCPDDETDPAFGETLRGAVAEGVKAFAFKCEVSLDGVRITGEIPVEL
ncbi:MAG: DNA/RNA nuclease SfsA [Chloroflexi bacterium]|nr:DNA/RNA nuclease SfsA [Chloroflexota bacterium]